MKREGFCIARCTVERLMKRLVLQGARRGKVVRTTISDMKAPCPQDRVSSQFKADPVSYTHLTLPPSDLG